MNKNTNKNTNKNQLKNVCRDWMGGQCKYNPCRFIHDPELCKLFYSNEKCDGTCGKNHFVCKELIGSNTNTNTNINTNTNSNTNINSNNKINKKHKPSNTETFKPDFTPPQMRILFEYGLEKTKLNFQSNDVIIVPDLFAGEPDIYNKLLGEIFATNFNKQELIIPWHEGSHLIVDDNLDWKKSCPTFNYVIDKVSKYFKMDVKATRFNWMQNLQDHKFFHYDGAALKPEIAKKQNSTIGISFGCTRDIAFQVASHPDCRKVVSIPLPDGYTYCFNKDVNIDWRHGVLPIKTNPDYKPGLSDGRISVVAWGWIDQIDVNPTNHI
jgi:hypothetical protein